MNNTAITTGILVSDTFASALVNNDWSGLNASETEKLKKFLSDKNYVFGFEDEEYAMGFTLDNVTGEFSNCYMVTFELINA